MNYCEKCDGFVKTYKKVLEKNILIRGKDYHYRFDAAICCNCGSQIFSTDELDREIEAIEEIYRKEEHIIRPAEIRELLSIYSSALEGDKGRHEVEKDIKKVEKEIKMGLISVEEINRLLCMYNIDAASLSIALGFEEDQITKYLMGQVPTKENSDLMLNFLSDCV